MHCIYLSILYLSLFDCNTAASTLTQQHTLHISVCVCQRRREMECVCSNYEQMQKWGGLQRKLKKKKRRGEMGGII